MAIYYVDPFRNTDGTGTFADPKGMWYGVPPTVVSGDELRIIGKPLTTLLTATEYTVTIRDSAVASNGGALSALSGGADADFLPHDIVYFPDYDVFMRLSAGTFSGGNYLSGTYNAVPIPVAGKLTGVRMRLVDRAILPTFTSSSANIVNNSNVANVTVTDNWTADGVRTTDGTAKTLVTTAAASNANIWLVLTNNVITEALKASAASTFDLSNSYFIAGRGTASALNLQRFVDTYNATITIAQVYANGTGNSTLSGSSGAIMYGYGNNITIKNINYNSGLLSSLATNSTYKFENVVSNLIYAFDTLSKYVNNTTIEFVNQFHRSFNSDGIVYAQGSQGLTVKLTGVYARYDNSFPAALVIGNGNVNVEFGSGFSATKNNQSSTPENVTSVTYALYDNTQFAQQNETYYRKPNLPTGFTVTNEFGLAIPAGSTVYPLGNGKRVATRKMVLEGFSATPTGANISSFYQYVNTTIVSSDGGFSPIEILGHQSASILNSGANTYFIASQDTSTFKTVSPSLRFNLATYNSSLWISNHPTRKARAYKNTAIPCVSGTPITVSGWVRTSDASYVSGDFSVSLVDANGDDVATEFNPTSAFINAWQQFSFTVTPTYTGELFLAFGMTGYRGGQTYWVSDMGVA